jgi:hypothetical protein
MKIAVLAVFLFIGLGPAVDAADVEEQWKKLKFELFIHPDPSDTGEFVPGGRFESVKAAVREVYDVWNKKYVGCAYTIYAVNNNYLPYRAFNGYIEFVPAGQTKKYVIQPFYLPDSGSYVRYLPGEL